MKRNVPLLITAAVGFILILSAFIPNIRKLSEETAVYFDIIAAFAFILGGGNLLRSHGEKIYKKTEGWGYSAVTVTAFAVTLIVGIGKVGVPPQTGLHAIPQQDRQIALITFDGTSEARELTISLRGAEADATLPIEIAGVRRAEIETDAKGNADMTLAWASDDEQPENAFLAEYYIPEVIARPGQDPADVPVYEPISVKIGSLSAELQPYGWMTGDHIYDGSAFWFIYSSVYRPLQATMFAMLAFYVASAAFRAFRARNAESVMLLGTAFIILLGRTAAGAAITYPLPKTGFLSFFRIENLADWIMLTFNTAGNRAIMIGIALGIVATSLKVLLGIDRSYLGSDKG